MFFKIFWKTYKKVNVRSKASGGIQHRNLGFKIVSKHTDKLCDWSQLAVKRQHVHCMSKHICTNQEKPTSKTCKFLVIVLTRARLVDDPATVPHLPRVAIPAKILATKAVSAQWLSFTVFFYPLGRTKALGLFQKSCMSSKSCNIAVNVLPHFALGFHSEKERSRRC